MHIWNLSQKGYNLIIEGTLRNPDVPIKTCYQLKEKGYNPDLVVVACDAETSWGATVEGAYTQREMGLPGRLVPLDIFDYTVNHISQNLNIIQEEKCFNSIKILDRTGKVLFPNGLTPIIDIMNKVLNLANWNEKLPDIKRNYIEIKIDFMKNELNNMSLEES